MSGDETWLCTSAPTDTKVIEQVIPADVLRNLDDPLWRRLRTRRCCPERSS